MAGSGSGISLGSILGRVFIYRWYVILPKTCYFLLMYERFPVLMMRPFPGGRTQISCPKEWVRPPVLDFLTERSRIPASAEEKFSLVSIKLVDDGPLCQCLITVRSRTWTGMEGGYLGGLVVGI